MSPCEVNRGSSPVILAFPHTGIEVPPAGRGRLNANGLLLADTDWHVGTLYDGLLPNATTVRATFHRYVIDANRDPAGGSLYPGQNTTALIPTTDFDGKPIWCEGREPTAGDITSRLNEFHTPYHAALAAEIARVESLHGVAVLYDCHSIRSQIPFLFAGRLPDFNVGTDNCRTCSPVIESGVVKMIAATHPFTHVLNGRFKGGWTTRHYGNPGGGVHALQMELAQSTYLRAETPPFAYDTVKAQVIRVHLKKILERIEQIAFHLPSRGTSP